MGQGMHADLRAYYDMHKEVLTAANVSYDGVVHALGLVRLSMDTACSRAVRSLKLVLPAMPVGYEVLGSSRLHKPPQCSRPWNLHGMMLCCLVQIGTRTFSRPHPSGQASIYYALPLLDMANHNNSCPHYNTFNACQSDPDRECVYFTAGADIKAGEEVCYWYGHLLPDRAFLEYGFLPEVPGSKPAKSKKRRKSSKVAEAQMPALPLFSIDRHDFDASEPLVKLQEPPKAFSGEAGGSAHPVCVVLDLGSSLWLTPQAASDRPNGSLHTLCCHILGLGAPSAEPEEWKPASQVTLDSEVPRGQSGPAWQEPLWLNPNLQALTAGEH